VIDESAHDDNIANTTQEHIQAAEQKTKSNNLNILI
jgi:hypothetical protein